MSISDVYFRGPQFFSTSSQSKLPNEPKSHLHIEFVDKANWGEIAQIARKWGDIAKEKNAQTEDPIESARFEDSKFICGRLFACLQDSLEFSPLDKNQAVYVCRDDRGEIQGIATIHQKRTRIKVDLLATHPRNIRSHINESEPNRVEGVARTIFNHIMNMGKKRKLKAIYLRSTGSAENFYLSKMGFRKDSNTEYLVKSLNAACLTSDGSIENFYLSKIRSIKNSSLRALESNIVKIISKL